MRNTFSRAAAAALALILIGGCASTPPIETQSSGTLPAEGDFALAEGVDPDLERAFSTWAEGRGLRPAERPAFLVQLSVSERPAGTGLFLPDRDDRQWLRAPDLSRKRRPVSTLAISIADTATGREVFRASAIRRGSGRRAGEGWDPLLQAVLESPGPSDAPAG
ncbi:hypothetical protein [Sphingosinicella sp. CPCC 101087]|uniref:hypothetical protein n=1 Tax=Sphingosinicella sp. CPCC 101087 TaxID=2497754 RepID=UPI00101D2F97|nr:hypothetical protein [Sphingosinicella sp. CPCC 101087]